MTTVPSQTNYTWGFVPRLPDKISWENRLFIGHTHRLIDIYQRVVATLKPFQIRGMVSFKTHMDQVKKIKNMNVSFLEMGDEICCQFTCKQHLEIIFKGCDAYAIPPSAIHTVTLFDHGYFIH
jgi:hypothetical protein